MLEVFSFAIENNKISENTYLLLAGEFFRKFDSKLSNYYNLADLFISLSTYHDILIEEPASLGNETLIHLVSLMLSSVPINYSSVAFYEYAKSAFQKKYLSIEK